MEDIAIVMCSAMMLLTPAGVGILVGCMSRSRAAALWSFGVTICMSMTSFVLVSSIYGWVI